MIFRRTGTCHSFCPPNPQLFHHKNTRTGRGQAMTNHYFLSMVVAIIALTLSNVDAAGQLTDAQFKLYPPTTAVLPIPFTDRLPLLDDLRHDREWYSVLRKVTKGQISNDNQLGQYTRRDGDHVVDEAGDDIVDDFKGGDYSMGWMGDRLEVDRLLLHHPFTDATKPHNPRSQISSSSPKYLKTGTTIVGIVVGNVCILAADTRATSGTLVADRQADKLHPLGKFAAAAGAGTSADLEHITRECYYSNMLRTRLQQIGNSGEFTVDLPDQSVLEVCHYLQKRLYEQGGTCQANLIVGGVDDTGTPHLRALHPHGSSDVVDYTALGSGGLAAMAVLESRYRQIDTSTNTTEEAIQLAVDAVRAGIVNDLGSGSQVDVCVIDKSGCRYTRAVLPEESLPFHPRSPTPTRSGVNGFGDSPFFVRSMRVIRTSNDEESRRQIRKWEDTLR